MIAQEIRHGSRSSLLYGNRDGHRSVDYYRPKTVTICIMKCCNLYRPILIKSGYVLNDKEHMPTKMKM